MVRETMIEYDWQWMLGWQIEQVDGEYQAVDQDRRKIHGTKADDLKTCLTLTTQASGLAIENIRSLLKLSYQLVH